MSDIVSSVYFGLVLSIAVYQICVLINKRWNLIITNPLFLSVVLIVGFLNIFHISPADFAVGGSILEMLIMPATVCLALSIYNNIDIVKNNFAPIIIGTLCGSVASVVSVMLLSHIFGLDETSMISIIPRSVTMPIALEISKQGGGLESLTTASVMISGIFGAMIAPFWVRIFKLDAVSSGLATGTSSHVAGTAKAVEMGEIQGAISGIAIGFTGLFTVLISLFL